VPGTVELIENAAAAPRAERHLKTYFQESVHVKDHPGFTGAWFERLGDPGRDDDHLLTGTDLMALSTLAIPVPAEVAIRLLQDKRAEIEELLRAIPVGVPIWEADDAVLGKESAAEELFQLIRRTGPRSDAANRRTAAFKLCARKRPALLPVYDDTVEEHFPREDGNWWRTARTAMRQPALRTRLTALRGDAEVPEQITLLRTLDVVLWLEARHQDGKHCGCDRG
jgi:Family of unknown function (DUF6308)